MFLHAADETPSSLGCPAHLHRPKGELRYKLKDKVLWPAFMPLVLPLRKSYFVLEPYRAQNPWFCRLDKPLMLALTLLSRSSLPPTRSRLPSCGITRGWP